jgi:pectate lyase
VSRAAVLAFAVLLAVAAAACGDAKLFPYVRHDGGGGSGGAGGTAGTGGVAVPCPDTMVGFAAVAGPDVDGGASQATTGGGNVAPTTVNSLDALTAALKSPDPQVILLDGMLTITDAPLKVTVDKDNRNGNKTLIGVGANSGLTGGGLDLSYADNVIIRNLKISKAAVGEGDAITILSSHHIWIDHCDLSSEHDNTTAGYDGLVDITHGSQFVTVSWTLLHDHKDTSLVGHTNDATAQADDQFLTVTYHHNLFQHVSSGPRVRWGTAHVFSNHFQDVTSFGVVSTSDALVWVEKNNFADDVTLAVATSYGDPLSGTMMETGDRFPANFPVDIMRPTIQPAPLPYSWVPDGADSVPAVVSQCAGTGQITLP